VAWYDSPSDQPSNLPLPLKNPFGKRNPRSNTRNNNEQHLQEAGGIGGRNLRAVKSDNQDYRPTSSLDRARELGVEDTKPHHATTSPNVESAPDQRREKLVIPRSGSPVNRVNTAESLEGVKDQGPHGSTGSETAVANEMTNEKPLDNNLESTQARKRGPLAKVTRLFHKGSETASDGNDNDPECKNKAKKTFSPMSQVRATILNSWINVLLIACECSLSRVTFLF
jgi:hypothetical protein